MPQILSKSVTVERSNFARKTHVAKTALDSFYREKSEGQNGSLGEGFEKWSIIQDLGIFYK